jgi:hypothetical protein
MTMEHAEFRRSFGADPKRTEADLLAHRASCAECARYAADLERVDQLVAGALEVPAPNYRKPWEVEASMRPARSHRRWYALAASLLIAIGIGAGGWLQMSRATLFGELLKHANAERNVMVASDKRVSEDKVRLTLAKAGARLEGSVSISTLRTCKVRGVVAPHLFVQTPAGPVQILLLTEHHFLMRHGSSDFGLQAELVPIGQHAVAVFAENADAVARGREIARQSIRWANDPG